MNWAATNRLRNSWRICAQVTLSAVLFTAGTSCRPSDRDVQDLIAAETESIASAVSQLESVAAGDIEYSVWLGRPDGEIWYQHNADSVRPAASAIKTAILIEFFSTQVDSLDSPFESLKEIVNNPDGPAIRHFNEEQKAAVRGELRELTARQLAEAMIHSEHVESNAAYNAAANVIIEYLGGPEALTERVRQRFPSAEELQVARYMLADRKENDDNLLTAEALATVLGFLAEGASFDELRTAAREVLFLEVDGIRGDHYYKGGTLTSDPQVRIEAGWWDYRGATCVYVVIATRPMAANNEDDFAKFRSNLGELSRIVQDAGIRIRDAVPR